MPAVQVIGGARGCAGRAGHGRCSGPCRPCRSWEVLGAVQVMGGARPCRPCRSREVLGRAGYGRCSGPYMVRCRVLASHAMDTPLLTER